MVSNGVDFLLVTPALTATPDSEYNCFDSMGHSVSHLPLSSVEDMSLPIVEYEMVVFSI